MAQLIYKTLAMSLLVKSGSSQQTYKQVSAYKVPEAIELKDKHSSFEQKSSETVINECPSQYCQTAWYQSYEYNLENLPEILRFTNDDDVENTLDILGNVVHRLRELSPLWEMHLDGIDLDTVKWNAH